MYWKNVRLIFRREMRDQLRDRRTLFMIAVLPVLFYPLLGVSFFQIAQFLRAHPSKILIVGYEPTRSELPSLIDNIDDQLRFSSEVFDAENAALVELETLPLERLRFVKEGKWPDHGLLTETLRRDLKQELRQLMQEKRCEAVVCFPPNFFEQLAKYPELLRDHARSASGPPPQMLSPELVFDDSSDKKGLAHVRVNRALDEWNNQVGRRSLEATNLPISAAHPIHFNRHNLADDEERVNTSLWSKILPFVLMIWAVTGAFYPAVDLCAGEKERGTLETLLSSPARRAEIVMGKLLTVMIFSIATAVLNLFSMGVTGAVVMTQLGDMAQMANVGPPPFSAMVWLSLLLIPVSALFSAICLALAAFARSTKEGQYYLMPVILVTMPLILLPMAPSVELNLGFSLIPVSGIVLLMRSMMEGTFSELWPYAFPVAAVTFACCWLSVRWAIEQFSSEEVLFREAERWDLGVWVRHLMRDREPTPTVALAVLCGVLVLIVKFFMGSAINAPTSMLQLQRMTFDDLVRITVITQLVMILAPAVIMAATLTRNPLRTFRIQRPPLMAIPAAALLAITLFPMIMAAHFAVAHVHQPRPEVQQFGEILQAKLNSAPVALSVMLVALLPAVCEELTFRGFILSGFRHTGHKWRAIVLTSLFFAVTHPILQQQVNAFFLGLILGYLAIQTGSIWPPLVYHCVHNATAYLSSRFAILDKIAGDDLYAGLSLFVGTMCSVILVFWFHELQYRRTKEEALQEAIDRESTASLAGPA